MRSEERGRDPHVRADVEHDVAGADPDVVAQVGLLADDLGDLEEELRAVVVVEDGPEVGKLGRGVLVSA
jgi:hypothetical protein